MSLSAPESAGTNSGLGCMIETQRAYEVNSKMIQAADEMMKNANQQM